MSSRPFKKPCLDRNKETDDNFNAYQVWVELGHGRTDNAVAKKLGKSPTTIGRWRNVFEWDKRLAERTALNVQKKKDALIIDPDDPIGIKLNDMMTKIEAIINSVFTKQHDGSQRFDLKIKNPDDLTKLIAEYRKFLETYHKFVAVHMPDKNSEKRQTNIKEMNLNFGDIPQADRIKLFEGIANGTGGNKQFSGGVQEADFEQVPERGDENGSGREGVSGSLASSEGGDEKTVPSV